MVVAEPSVSIFVSRLVAQAARVKAAAPTIAASFFMVFSF
jgi:hypothetical protein